MKGNCYEKSFVWYFCYICVCGDFCVGCICIGGWSGRVGSNVGFGGEFFCD